MISDYMSTIFQQGEARLITTSDYTIHTDISLIRKKDYCWKCNELTTVYCLVGWIETPNKKKTVVALSFLEKIPHDLDSYLKKSIPLYQNRYSRTAEMSYHMNHCASCGAPSGDNFLHFEHGGAFNKLTWDEVKKLHKSKDARKILKKPNKAIEMICAVRYLPFS